MLGRRFDSGADPQCLADTSESVASDLVSSVFETKP